MDFLQVSQYDVLRRKRFDVNWTGLILDLGAIALDCGRLYNKALPRQAKA